MSRESDALAQAEREAELTRVVTASFAGGDARARLVMSSLVRHLHAFLREVRLTEQEWTDAIGFLTRAGQISDDKRQEFILLSDVLGASMMTVAINHPADADATESTVFGPFFVENAPLAALGDDIARGMTGRPCYVHGSVTGTDGSPIPDARIEVWAADDDGFYDVQLAGDALAGRAHLFADAAGLYDFWTVQPSPYPIPHDGPVGRLLERTGRHPMRPAHIHFMVSAPGYRTLITHIFVAGDEWLTDDAVFGVKQSLIVPFAEHPAGRAPRERDLDETWSEAVFDIVLAPASAG